MATTLGQLSWWGGRARPGNAWWRRPRRGRRRSSRRAGAAVGLDVLGRAHGVEASPATLSLGMSSLRQRRQSHQVLGLSQLLLHAMRWGIATCSVASRTPGFWPLRARGRRDAHACPRVPSAAMFSPTLRKMWFSPTCGMSPGSGQPYFCHPVFRARLHSVGQVECRKQSFRQGTSSLAGSSQVQNKKTEWLPLGYLQPFPPSNSLQTYYLLYFTTSL